MTASDIQNLPVEEKLRIMEAIWIDLRDRVKNAPIPEAHRKLLDERSSRVGSGEATSYTTEMTSNTPFVAHDYTCDGKKATVWAVVDCRRDLDWILEHLKR